MSSMSFIKGIIFFLLCWVRFSYEYEILAIYPQGFKSHFIFNTALMNILRKAGHNIAYITPFESLVSNETFNIKNTAKVDFNSRVTIATDIKSIGMKNREQIVKISWFKTLYEWSAFEELLCHDIMELDEIQNTLAGRIRFDVIFTEMMSMHGCYLLIAHKLNIPIIGTLPTSPWTSERIIGNPINPVYIPNAWSHTGNRMTLFDRLKNTVFTSTIYLWETCVEAVREEAFRRKHFPGIEWADVNPPALLFLNSHPILQPRPIVPNAIEIGGAHIGPDKPLPENFQNFIDEAEHGVILVTFGTNNSTWIGDIQEIIPIFVGAFASIPQRVIWKLDQSYENVTENIMITEWIPQQDVLRHKNVKAFISHCGAFGMHEAVHTGTPVVGVPLHIDQIHNALLLEELGVGIYVDITTMTQEILLDALNKIINDTRYRNNMKKLSIEFNDHPMTAAEKIVYWTEYVIKYKGTPHLKTYGTNMPLYQHLYLDVMLCLVIIFTLIFIAVFYTTKLLMTIFGIEYYYNTGSKKNK